MPARSAKSAQSAGGGATLHVDWTRCDGHGTCADLLPELIERDDWGFPVLKNDGGIPGQARERADLAVEACPMVALTLVSARRR